MTETHIPSISDSLPRWARSEISRSDHTIHAGCFDSVEAYNRITDLANDLTAVEGPGDPIDLDLPDTASVEIEEMKFEVTHAGHTPPPIDHLTDTANRTDSVLVVGRPEGDRYTIHDGTKILSPGSPTAANHKTQSIQKINIDDGTLKSIKSIYG